MRTYSRSGAKFTRILNSYTRLTGVASITLLLLYPVSIVDVIGWNLLARRKVETPKITDMFMVK